MPRSFAFMVWNARGETGQLLPNGVYGYRLVVGSMRKSGRIVVIR